MSSEVLVLGDSRGQLGRVAVVDALDALIDLGASRSGWTVALTDGGSDSFGEFVVDLEGQIAESGGVLADVDVSALLAALHRGEQVDSIHFDNGEIIVGRYDSWLHYVFGDSAVYASLEGRFDSCERRALDERFLTGFGSLAERPPRSPD